MRAISIAAVAAILSGCSGAGLSAGIPPAARAVLRESAASARIRHVVIVVQENRSFNNLFYGYPGAGTVKYGRDSRGRKIALAPIGLEGFYDIDHSSTAFFAACNGRGVYPGTECRMNGFNREYAYCGHASQPRCPIAHPQYAYVPHRESKPYFQIAQQYVLGDRMFASNFDGSSFVSHQYLIAGQASASVNFPTAEWGCEGGRTDTVETVSAQRVIGNPIVACFNNLTLGDELDAAGLSWAYYTSQTNGNGGEWSAYQAIAHIYDGPDWFRSVIAPQTQFFDDVADGKLPSVSWITPTCENSDHAGCDGRTGPSWVASLVDAIGQSPYWDSTAIFIFWDDYGGWYDPVPPRLVDYDGLGIRVPLLVVSPYAKRGYVSHVHYEHGSLLKFVEDVFGLARLAPSDTRAQSPEGDAFDFNQPARKFRPIPHQFSETYFKRQAPDRRPPDAQ